MKFKRGVGVFLFLGILFIFSTFAYNLGFNTLFNEAKNFGIDGSNVMVSVRGENMSLQNALDNNLIGICNPGYARTEEITEFEIPEGWHSGYDIDVVVPSLVGGAVSLQEAIHRGYLGGGVYNSIYTEIGDASYFGHSSDEVIVRIGEEEKTLQQAINDGNLSGGDCCGNGVVDAGEQCDDGNDNDGDGCTNDCISQFVQPLEFNISFHDYTYISGTGREYSSNAISKAVLSEIPTSGNSYLITFDIPELNGGYACLHLLYFDGSYAYPQGSPNYPAVTSSPPVTGSVWVIPAKPSGNYTLVYSGTCRSNGGTLSRWGDINYIYVK